MPGSPSASKPLSILSILCLSLLGAGCGSAGNDVAIVRSQSAGSDTAGGGAPPSTAADSEPGSSPEPGADPDQGGGGDVEEIEWNSLGDNLEGGYLTVPVDHGDEAPDEDGATFELFVVRHLALDPEKRIGSLLVNPGGPGFGGVVLAQQAEFIYSEDLLDHFDIVGWDPRGTGQSEPAIDCIDEYDRYFAALEEGLDADEVRQQNVDLAIEFEAECERNNREILGAVGTNNSARDMDSIRRALDEDTISYFGFSYGSELGATWATLFPDTVRAAVLDGAADPNADELESNRQQARGFENSLNNFLADCSDNPGCEFHNDGDAETAYDELIDELDKNPVPSESGRPDVGVTVATSGVVQAMYDESLWPQLAEALAQAQNGEGAGLLALYDSYFQRRPDGTYDNSLEAFQVISCADEAERLSAEEQDAQAPLFAEVAPRLYGDIEGGSYFCTFFPASTDPRVAITGLGAGPILVVGTTGDPATPLDSSRNMAKALDEGVLLVVDAEQHTGYDVNDCSMGTVDAYLIDLAVPEPETEC